MSARSAELGVRNAELRPKRLRTQTNYLVGGVNSPVRAFKEVGGKPILLARAKGAAVWDDHGRQYLDFIMGWGAEILGHNPKEPLAALRKQLSDGPLMGLTHPAEAQLAARIAEAVPNVEQIRFTVSGTEACLTAVKLARAHTGRSKVLVFDGCYHGHGESLMAGKSAGLPNALSGETISVPYNDVGAAERAIERFGQELAAVIVEPVAANMGVVVPDARFLIALRAFATRRNAVLIFDEVVTGFRLGLGGAQAIFDVRADLTTFGKIIGGGLPMGAVGGSRAIMQRLAPEGDVYHGGTFAGHPLSMAAGLALITALTQRPPYAKLERLSKRLADGIAQAAIHTRIPVQVNRIGSMLTVFFTERPVRNAQQAKASQRERFTQWANALRQEGILVPPSPCEALFISTAHTEAQIDRTVRASQASFTAMRSGR